MPEEFVPLYRPKSGEELLETVRTTGADMEGYRVDPDYTGEQGTVTLTRVDEAYTIEVELDLEEVYSDVYITGSSVKGDVFDRDALTTLANQLGREEQPSSSLRTY